MAKLTEGAVAALKVPEGKRDVIVFDDALPGFGVRKFASGKASYFVKYRLGAQQRKITLGHALPGILADIRRQAAKVLAEVKLGQDVATRKKEAAAKKSATIGGLIEGYIAERQLRLKPRTMEGIVLHLRGHWASLHGRGGDGPDCGRSRQNGVGSREHFALRLLRLVPGSRLLRRKSRSWH